MRLEPARQHGAARWAGLLALLPVPAFAATGQGAESATLSPATLSLWWGLPFAAMLLSIALMPIFAGRVWHHHQGKIAAGWAALFLVPFAASFGLQLTWDAALHTLLHEYLPFVILLTALYTVSGGIAVRGNLHGSPAQNTLLLAIGAVLASVMGTTGAAMLMVRPVIRANDARRHNAHVLVFFIFLVANVGGALTPLGDPPLFLGFLKGVDFFWTLKHLLAPTVLLCALLLAVFYLLDRWFWRKEDVRPRADPTPDSPLGIIGGWNVLWLVVIVAAVLHSGIWKPGVTVPVLGQSLDLQNLTRDAVLVLAALLSLATTPRQARHENAFTWGPMIEVGKLFLGIFLTIIPVIAILRAGSSGALASLVRLTTDAQGQPIAATYFWLTGALSSFLDNAPTYLVFFNLAGGDAAHLMTQVTTLAAISAGAVFMGAVTYIGNAPNFMVKAIAEHRGVRMPSFFGYMGWSFAILLPCFLLLTLVFFR
ncbi:MAG: sodium:proton antiporter [Burkholderiaceae bacterium]|nr:sodium:proton antiporter [Burkholderiaceae bacterium]